MPDKKTLRTFGAIWALIFFIISYKYNMNALFLSASLFFAVSSAFFPELYFKTHVFQSWVKFGNFLGKINSKIITFILFFFIFTPIAFVLKILGKDLLNKKLSKEASTYFVARDTQAGPMINQF